MDVMSTRAEDSAGSSRGEFDAMWRRQEIWWHALFAGVVLISIMVVQMEPPGRFGRWPTLALFGLLALAYALFGVQGLRQDRRYGVIYQAIAWAIVMAVLWADPESELFLLFFALFPQLWAMLPRGWAIAWISVTFCLIGIEIYVIEGRNPASLPAIATALLVSFVTSLALGLFITRLVHETEQRAATIDVLHETQARLASAERDRGAHEERERMSREIHDTLAQGFTSVLALTRAANAALARGDIPTARERLALVQATATDNLSQARLIVAETSPGHLASRTLIEAVERLVTAIRIEAGLDARLEVVGTPVSLGAAADIVLLRAVQESLANVRKHARASRVTVQVRYAEGEPTRVEVTDDGIGFDDQPDRRGFGLDGLLARAQEVGGSMRLTSPPDGGTSVVVEVPR